MPRPRRDYRIDLAADGTLTTERGHELHVPAKWTPEHLLLAALTRCSLLAVEYHARRASLEAGGTGWASASVDRREDGQWAMLDVECSLEVTVEPPPPPDQARELVAAAERGCFIGSSLQQKPSYRWRL